MVLIQHLFGIRFLRQTVKEIQVNVAYRWFLGFNLTTEIPHFATVSYAIAQRFPSELFEEIFTRILEEAIARGHVDPTTVFIDTTQIKASANKKKHRKELALQTARVYDEQPQEGIDQDRKAHGKRPLKDRKMDNDGLSTLFWIFC